MVQARKVRPKFFRKRSQKPFELRQEEVGSPPGTLLPSRFPRKEKAKITIIDYSQDEYNESTTYDVEDCAKYKDSKSVTWINIDSVDDVNTLSKLGEYFNVHPLALEDIQDTDQRPKLEEYDDLYLIVTKLLRFRDIIVSEQVSMLLGKKYVITIQMTEEDCFDPIRDRLRSGTGRIRSMGPDYLAYSLMDVLTDEYYPILQIYGDELERLEDTVFKDPRPHMLQKIQRGKRDLLLIRRSILPNREILGKLMRDDETGLIAESTKRYLRDCQDNTIQISDIIETYRDMSSSLQDLYLSSISHRMNEVMKVLTIIATIFIPLTFITGLYGMNFDAMPELHWEWGYYASLTAMFMVSISMLIYFKRKRWL